MKQKLLAVLLGFAAVLVPAILLGAADLTGRPTGVALIRDPAWTLVLDDMPLYLGNSSDVDIHWDATNGRFEIEPVTNNTQIRIGTGTSNCDLLVYGSAAANNMTWDASANSMTFNGSATMQVTTLTVTGAILPDADGGITFGASGNGIGNTFITGNTVTTGSVQIGASGTAAAAVYFGQVTISNGASSASVALTDIASTDSVSLTALEILSTGTVIAQIEAGIGFDVVLVDMTDGAQDAAASDYTISYVVYEH